MPTRSRRAGTLQGALPSPVRHAPLPPNEASRLGELRAMELLDTPPEARFDRLVELAAAVLCVPMSYISLVDAERQWFKAKCGLTSDGTGRRESFCAHTILEDAPLIIPDAAADPRFEDSPLVVGEPFVRFYAGHPLRSPAGLNVATLCIADRRPRELDRSQLAIFGRLAAIAEHELRMVDVIKVQRELIATKDALIATQSRLAVELGEAAEYVRSLLPGELEAPLHANYEFVASSQLGGDLLGYHWIDGKLAIYLLDVMGHGVGAALLSTSVQAALRNRILPGVRFDDPAAVLTGLNAAFPMSRHGGRFFTIFYAVFDPATRTLEYANAGHPPALLLSGGRVERLHSTGIMVGALRDAGFEAGRTVVAPGARLVVYSDGAIELPGDGREMLMVDGFERVVAQAVASTAVSRDPATREILRLLEEAGGAVSFGDDVSLLELRFE